MNNNQTTYHGLLLDNKLYPIETLIPFCEEEIQNADCPVWKKDIYRFVLEFLGDGDTIVQYTSGTTGDPKPIELPKMAMHESALMTARALNLKFAQTALLCLPINYIAGKMMVVRALVSGLNLHLVEPSSLPDLSSFKKIDFCSMVPLQAYNSFSNYEFQTHIDKLIIGGGEIRDELEAMLRDLPNQVYETYGMTETSSHIALRRINGDNPEDTFTVLPGIEFELDQRGCLVISAPFLNAKVVTDDQVEIVARDQFRWLGRYDNMINTGGLKLQPENLEKDISRILNVNCAVIDKPDPALGQKIVLVVESGDKLITLESVSEKLQGKIDKHFLPQEVFVIPNLPRTQALKIDRTLLRLKVKELAG